MAHQSSEIPRPAAFFATAVVSDLSGTIESSFSDFLAFAMKLVLRSNSEGRWRGVQKKCPSIGRNRCPGVLFRMLFNQ
jgi:hypothetical protein